jgi:DNA-binding HxlR family transcriptional regulator
VRPGAQALTLLSSPLNVNVLTALADGPLSLPDLRRAAGSPPQTTMRKYLQSLNQFGVLRRGREASFPGRVRYELTEVGLDLSRVVDALQAWLRIAPDEALSMGSPAAKSAIKAFVDAWSANILRALAARPLTLTELDALIKGLNYPSLERRLAAMRFAGQITEAGGAGKGTPYTVTHWLRVGVGPLVLAADWERRHLRGRAPSLSGRDAEAIFLLSVPLMSLPEDTSGSFRFAVEVGSDSERRLAGVRGETSHGRISALTSQLNGVAEATALGTAGAWLSVLGTGESERLELGGDKDSARRLLAGLRRGLFRRSGPSPTPEPTLEAARSV